MAGLLDNFMFGNAGSGILDGGFAGPGDFSPYGTPYVTPQQASAYQAEAPSAAMGYAPQERPYIPAQGNTDFSAQSYQPRPGYGQPAPAPGWLQQMGIPGGNMIDQLGSRLNNPLVQFGLGLASGKTPQEGFGNALHAQLQRQKIEHDTMTAEIKEYNFARMQGFGGSFTDFLQQKANFNQKSALTPFYVQNKDGTIDAYQMNDRGGASKVKIPEGASAAVPNRAVDTGTGTAIISNRGTPAIPQEGVPGTGNQGVLIPKDLSGAAAAKKEGTNTGQAQFDLPRIEQNATRALDVIQQIRDHPGKKYAVGFTGVIPGIPGTEQKDFINLVDQAKGQAFLEAFQTLKGGGQITEIEGAKATDAIARLDRTQSVGGFNKALSDLEGIIKTGVERAKTQAKKQPASAAPLADPFGLR